MKGSHSLSDHRNDRHVRYHGNHIDILGLEIACKLRLQRRLGPICLALRNYQTDATLRRTLGYNADTYIGLTQCLKNPGIDPYLAQKSPALQIYHGFVLNDRK